MPLILLGVPNEVAALMPRPIDLVKRLIGGIRHRHPNHDLSARTVLQNDRTCARFASIVYPARKRFQALPSVDTLA